MNAENKKVLEHIKLRGAEIGHVYNCQFGEQGEARYEENAPCEVLGIKKDDVGRPVLLVRKLQQKRHIGIATLGDEGTHGAVYCARSRVIGAEGPGWLRLNGLADAKRALGWQD
jgi:hypothetical protein